MNKHVCPVCENVYAVRGVASVSLENWTSEYECWICPSCGFQFVSIDDLREIVKRLPLRAQPKIVVSPLISTSV